MACAPMQCAKKYYCKEGCLIIENEDGDIIFNELISDVKIAKTAMGNVKLICEGMDPFILNCGDFDLMGVDKELFYAEMKQKRKDDANAPVIVEGDVNVNKTTTQTFCNLVSGEICEVDICFDEDRVPTYYTHAPFTTYQQAEFETKFERFVQSIYETLDYQIWFDASDKKMETPICVVPRKNKKTEQIEYYLETDTEFSNILIKTDYIMPKGREFGRIAREEIKTFKKGLTLRFETDGTDQNINTLAATNIAAFIAGIKETLPDGSRVGVSCISVQQIPQKRKVFDDIALADFVVEAESQVLTTATLDGSNTADYTVVGDTPNHYGINLVDAGECDGCADEACEIDGTVNSVVVNGPANNGIEVCLDFACFRPATVAEA